MRMFFARTKNEHEGGKTMTGISAVETPVRNFVSELAEAEHHAQRTEVAERLARAAVQTQENLIAGAEADIRWERGSVETNRQIISNAKSNLRLRLADLPKAIAEAEKASTALDRIRFEIENHPTMLAAKSRRRALLVMAVNLAAGAWDTPILKLAEIKIKFDRLADEERALVNRENVFLREARLPTLSPLIADESMNILPAFIFDFPVGHIASDCAKARARLLAR